MIDCGSCYRCLNKPEMGLLNPIVQRTIVCPECGNKRCPRATHHGNPCTHSNEPGQPGSLYEEFRSPPSNAKRAAYFTAHRTSTAEQVSRRPLSSRLIDVAALAFLRGLAVVGWVKRRVRW